MALDVIKGKAGVALGEGRALREIGQRLRRDKIVALEHAVDALADDLRREQFGERRRDGFEQRFLADEMHIGFDGEFRRRQQAAQRHDVIAVEAEPVGEFQPARNAAFALALAVVIGKAAPPFAARRLVVAARDQARVLDRDHGLVIVAVERPGLDLALAAFAAVQELVERMQPVITPRADVAQRRFQLLRCHQLHSTISRPSSAISQPAATTRSRSGEPSIRIGLVLLMCTKMRRARKPASASSEPSGPSSGIWPMRRPVFSPVSVAIISSSRNSVPSKKMTSARARRCITAGVIAAAPGTKASRASLLEISTPTLAELSLAVSGSSPSR